MIGVNFKWLYIPHESVHSMESKKEKEKKKECPTLGHSLSRPIMMYQNSKKSNFEFGHWWSEATPLLACKSIAESVFLVAGSTVSQWAADVPGIWYPNLFEKEVCFCMLIWIPSPNANSWYYTPRFDSQTVCYFSVTGLLGWSMGKDLWLEWILRLLSGCRLVHCSWEFPAEDWLPRNLDTTD